MTGHRWRGALTGGLAVVLGAGLGAGGLLALAAPAGAVTVTTDLYVSTIGTPVVGDTCPVTNPCLTIQQALTVAGTVVGKVVVIIAAGTYDGGLEVVGPGAGGDETALTLQPAQTGTTFAAVTVTAYDTNGLDDQVAGLPVTVRHITITSTTDGVLVHGPGATFDLSFSTITGSGGEVGGNPGLYVTTAAEVKVTGSTITDNNTTGIYVNGHSLTLSTTAFVTIQTSRVLGNHATGISLVNGARVRMSTSTVGLNGEDGVTAGGSKATIQFSHFFNNGTKGIDFYTGTGFVDSSTVDHNIGDGIDITDSTATITDSTISVNAGTGVVVQATATVGIWGSTVTNQVPATPHDEVAVNIFTTAGVTLGGDLIVATPAVTLGAACAQDNTSTYTDAGDNVVTDTSCDLSGTSRQTVTEATVGLGPLDPNGGHTDTEAISLTSAANDVVPTSATLNTVTTVPWCALDDQRGTGYPRLVNGATSCAAGAFQPAPPLQVATTSLPGGTTGTAYSAQLTTGGGAGTLTWTVTSGTFPPGLTLGSDGAVTGTPTAHGNYPFTVKVTDSEGQTATAVLSIAVVAAATGYDLVGSDGGVFVFDAPGQTGGFFGSLPTLDVVPNKPVVGMVPTVADNGYFLVGSDGGVFAFGAAPFLGSLPGIHVTPNQPIVGIVAANTDKGYFLVGKDGGVYAFGTVPFLGSLPSKGKAVSNVIGISATPSGAGYWVVQATGTVTAFGTALSFATPSTTSPVAAIAGTASGQGYWLVTAEGGVYPLGDAAKAGTGTLPHIHVVPSVPVIGIVPTAATAGYWLLGADGGIFAFGPAPFYGSLPGLGVHVTNIVGAVPN